ncbi:MAG TPA: sigma 54-interacting transcriptional regulator, partial [Methylophilaceae bacterium]|nr:sigma 54-interacting transcriptional regulator [Methylophilaceae bacterium]
VWRQTIVTRSPQMENLLGQAKLMAMSDASVLIQGESGTGKELLARAIHQASPRHAQPFIPINCGAIPEALLESELFGHSKGAFTGALREHKGLFQSADGGTLFLDEIGDMPLPLQVKLLRVLQERVVRPVGSNASIPINVRVISATHRNLGDEMKAGRFREDLYYRINVVGLEIPALAARREDISLLANNFLQLLSKKYGKKLNGFSPDAMELLIAAPWPGNVRQLQNIVEQTVVLSTTPLVPATLVQKALQDDIGSIMSFETARKNFERDYLIKLLKATNGSVTQASRLAQRNRTEFYKLLQRHQLTPALFKNSSPVA